MLTLADDIRQQVEKWQRNNHNKVIRIKLVAPDISSEDRITTYRYLKGKEPVGTTTYQSNDYAYFLLIADDERYPFVIGPLSRLGRSKIPDAENNIFDSDYSGSCDNRKQCIWASHIQTALNKKKRLFPSLGEILTLAVETYETINSKPVSTNAPANVIGKQSLTTLQRLITIAGQSNGVLQIEVENENEWMINIAGKYNNIRAKLYIKTTLINDENIHGGPILRVIEPRLKLGRNMSFGGLVLYKGLTPHTWDNNDEILPQRILNALYNEEFDNIHMSPYTHANEFAASWMKVAIHANNLNKRPWLALDVVIYDNPLKDINVVYVSHEHKALFGNEPANMMSELGINGVYYVHYTKLDDNYIQLSSLQCINLNISVNHTVTLMPVDLQVANKVTVRPRQKMSNKKVKDCLLSVGTLNVGHTVKVPNIKQYIDIIDCTPDTSDKPLHGFTNIGNMKGIIWGLMMEHTSIHILPALQ
jgi:hypothetical protein